MRLAFRLPIAGCILVTAFLAGAKIGQAQAIPTPTPTLFSGSDIGFRVDGQKGSTPVGSLVIRVNGQWVEPEYSVKVKLLNR